MKEVHLQSWPHFLKIADHDPSLKLGSFTYACRGQSNAQWDLTPSLLRILPSELSAQEVLDLEHTALNTFKSQAHLYLSPSDFATTTDPVSWFTVMQHHGVPTRILDWTNSIYVAAYFAVHGTPSSDGAVWLVCVSRVHEHMKKIYGESVLPIDIAIKDQLFHADAPEVLKFVERHYQSHRMIAQQGIFSLCSNVRGHHGEILRNLFCEQSELEFLKLIVPSSLKPTFAQRLRAMNIAVNSLFPGIDGLGKSVAELIKLGGARKKV